MSIAALVKTLLAAGVEHDVIVAAVEAVETRPVDAQAERRRAADRERKRVKGGIPQNSADSAETPSPLVPPPLSPEPPNSPPYNPPNPEPPVSLKRDIPQGGRGHRLPVDWEPKAAAFEYGSERGLSEAMVRQCADEMRDWAAANANRPVARKIDWDRAFLGWLRRARAGPAPPNRKPSIDQFFGKTGT